MEVWKSNEKANWYKNLCFSKINTVVSISSSANNTPKKKSHSYELILCTRLAEVYLRVRQLFHLLVVTMFSAQSKRAVLPMQIDITHVHLANLSFSSFSYDFAVHKTNVSCLKQICERPFKESWWNHTWNRTSFHQWLGNCVLVHQHMVALVALVAFEAGV